MKNYLKILCVFLLTASCGGPQEADQQSTISAETEMQWLTMSGDVDKPHVVLVSGDEEYRSEEALPQLGKILSQRHGFNCTVLFAQDPDRPGYIDPNYLHNIPGLSHLEKADIMVIFTRFRALPDEQMKHIDDYLKSGKPVLGIRTSTHGFHFEEAEFESSYKHYGNFYEGEDEWNDGFGRLVLGEKWISHHGEHGDQSTRGIPAPGSENHPILNGIESGGVWGPTDVYGVRLPLPGDAAPILLGQVVNRSSAFDEADPRLGMRPTDSELPGLVMREDDQEVEINQNDPMMPIAWTKSYQIPGGEQGKVFATTIGASTDLLQEGTRRMMVNAVFWGLGLEVPEKANVDLVGSYSPTRFAFYEDEYWDDQNVKVSDLE